MISQLGIKIVSSVRPASNGAPKKPSILKMKIQREDITTPILK
jgi:hypothetical protein